MALSPCESYIMDLYDAGHKPSRVAAITGLSKRRVNSVIEFYSGGVATDRLYRDKITKGSRALREAVLAAGGHG